MKKETKNFYANIAFKNRYSLMSLVIILAMYLITTTYYNPNSSVRVGASMITNGEAGAVGGSFFMKDASGKGVDETILQGKATVLFFGFTNCPDICPTALSELNNVYESMPKDIQKDVQVLFVTLDPNRDTQEHLNDYMQAFNPSFKYLRGTKEQTKQIASQFSVFYSFGAPDKYGDYNVNHTGFMYLMNSAGEFVRTFEHNEKGQIILRYVMEEARKIQDARDAEKDKKSANERARAR